MKSKGMCCIFLGYAKYKCTPILASSLFFRTWSLNYPGDLDIFKDSKESQISETINKSLI